MPVIGKVAQMLPSILWTALARTFLPATQGTYHSDWTQMFETRAVTRILVTRSQRLIDPKCRTCFCISEIVIGSVIVIGKGDLQNMFLYGRDCYWLGAIKRIALFSFPEASGAGACNMKEMRERPQIKSIYSEHKVAVD